MSDFLTHLALLTRGEADVVKPRLPGRFAPEPDAGMAESAEPDGRAAAAAAPYPGEQPPPLVDSVASGTEPPPAPHPGTGPEHGQAAQRRVRAAAEHEPSAAEPGRENARMSGPDSPNDAAGSAAGTGEPGKPAAAAAGGDMADRRRAASGRDAPDRREGSPAVRPRPGETMPDLPEPVAPDRPSPARSETPLVPVGPVPHREGQRRPKMPPIGAEPEARTAPSVHVTIGRVEVRAHTVAPAPKPSRPRSESAGTLSLQDYLKRGAGGGERP